MGGVLILCRKWENTEGMANRCSYKTDICQKTDWSITDSTYTSLKMSRLAQVREAYIATSIIESVSEQDIRDLVEKVMLSGAASLGQRQMLMECHSSRFVERMAELIRKAVREFEYPQVEPVYLTDSSLYL